MFPVQDIAILISKRVLWNMIATDTTLLTVVLNNIKPESEKSHKFNYKRTVALGTSTSLH